MLVGDFQRPVSRRRLVGERLVVGRAQVHPAGDLVDRFVGEFRLLKGHVRLFLMPDELQQSACGRGLADLAAVDQGFTAGEVEAAHGLPAAMAGQAAFGQERPNLLLEHLDAFSHPPGVTGGIFGSE